MSILLTSTKRALHLVLMLSLIFLPSILKAQTDYGTITGKVTDAKFGEPLPFVRIQVIDSKLGTVSQTDGRYSFRVPPG
ncbi:MAG: carboxypeptidase regulatory-like domain-containing protein, partial [Candidatus Thermochlorobacter sp.]